MILRIHHNLNEMPRYPSFHRRVTRARTYTTARFGPKYAVHSRVKNAWSKPRKKWTRKAFAYKKKSYRRRRRR